MLLSACSVITAPVARPPPDAATVFVIARSWHTDIGLPIDEISGPLRTLEQRFPGVRMLTFGFGERQFLLSRHVTIGETLSALLPSESALLVTALIASPGAAFGTENVVALRVSPEGLARIEASIWRELQKQADGAPQFLTEGPHPGSEFFAATGTYDMFNTCNTWTATTLHAGGLPMPTGVLFVGQVMSSARAIASRQTSMLRHG